jgi:hypothetical protein
MLPFLVEAHSEVCNAGATNPYVARLLNICHFANDAAGMTRMNDLLSIRKKMAGCLHI